MTSEIPDQRAAMDAFHALPKAERDWVYWAVETGRPVHDPAHAGIAVAYARHRLRIGLVRDLPFYGASAVAAGLGGYFFSDGSSAAFAFAFVLGLAAFVGHLWWWSTWRPRQRALAVNLALASGGEPPVDDQPDSLGGNDWWMAVTLAWVTSMVVSGVVHLVLGGAQWVGLPTFVVALVLYRRLIRRTVESIDDWRRRAT